MTIARPQIAKKPRTQPGRRLLVLMAGGVTFTIVFFGLPIALVGILQPERAQAIVAAAQRWAGNHAHPTGQAIGSFKLIDERGESVSSESLKGRIWIASFFISRCAGTCPQTAGKMRQLQSTIQDPDILFVSFSMDPEHDTVDVLSAYAAKMGANETRWKFLTGDRQVIERVVNATGVNRAPGAMTGQMIHSDHFALIDRAGYVRGVYDSNDATALQHLKADADALAANRF